MFSICLLFIDKLESVKTHLIQQEESSVSTATSHIKHVATILSSKFIYTTIISLGSPTVGTTTVLKCHRFKVFPPAYVDLLFHIG